MESVYKNDQLDSPSTSQKAPTNSKRIRSAVWFLVILSFLLLAGIIGFTIYDHVSAHHDRENLLSSLTDLLNANRNETTEEQQRLQSLVKQNNVSAHHDRENLLSSLTDLLNANRNETTEEQQRLQSLVKQNHVSAQHERGNLLSSLTDLLNANHNETTEEQQRLQSLVKQNHVSAQHERGNLLSSLTDLLNANHNETTEEQQRLQSLVKQNNVSAHHDRENLLSSLTDLLNANRNETTEEQQRLQSLVKQSHALARHSSAELSAIEANLNVKLTKISNELGRLQCLITQNRTCPDGWKVFGCSCYFFSTETKTWNESRQDCRNRGADLVIVDSFGEQEFLTKNINRDAWIGLSDRDNEGTWKWTDGTPLTKAYWGTGEPNNKGGEEDCVHLYTKFTTERNWNDQDCDDSIRWICEK